MLHIGMLFNWVAAEKHLKRGNKLQKGIQILQEGKDMSLLMRELEHVEHVTFVIG